jgi:hypothetical protein
MPGMTVNTTNRPPVPGTNSNLTGSTGPGGFEQGSRLGSSNLPGNTNPTPGNSYLGAGDPFPKPSGTGIGGPGASAIPGAGSTGNTPPNPFKDERPSGSNPLLTPPPAGAGRDPISGGNSNPVPIPGAPTGATPIPNIPSNPAIPGAGLGSTDSGVSRAGYTPSSNGGVTTTTTAPPLGLPPYSAPGGGVPPQMAGDPLPPLNSHQ